MRSRDVLAECRQALEDFRGAGPTPYWRTRWTGLVALLRSVGHVLDKIDGAQSDGWKRAVNEAWNRCKQTKPEPRILWEFIEAERNNVLKAYEVGARLNVTVRPAPAVLSFSESIARHQKSDATSYETFLKSGFYGGRDAIRAVAQGSGFDIHDDHPVQRRESQRIPDQRATMVAGELSWRQPSVFVRRRVLKSALTCALY